MKVLQSYAALPLTIACGVHQLIAKDDLEVLDFLQLHRSEGCSPWAMDQAAAHGHLAAVKWLHTHRTEGCSSYAMSQAACNGHLEVLQYLHTEVRAECTAEILADAACSGQGEVVAWLHRVKPVEFERSAEVVLSQGKTMGLIEWLDLGAESKVEKVITHRYVLQEYLLYRCLDCKVGISLPLLIHSDDDFCSHMHAFITASFFLKSQHGECQLTS